MALGKDIVESLQLNFPEMGESIAAMAFYKLLYQSSFKNMEYYYEESFLSELYPNLNLSKNSITSLLNKLGHQEEAILSFKKRFLKGSQNIVFDLTHLLSQSSKMDINLPGYNSNQEYEPQVNLFYLFSTDLRMPAYYRVMPGNISGMKALKITLEEAELRDCTLIGDKGFGSRENIETLDKEGFQYILPLRRNNPNADYAKLESRDYKKALDGHFFYQERPIFYASKADNGHQYTMFFDSKLRLQEESDYLLRIEKKFENYSMDGFLEKQLTFGTILTVTNTSLPAQEVYERYKSRMEVEVMFDTFKNTLQADSSSMQSKESFESWVLINHIALIMYYRLQGIIRKANLLKQYSAKDILERLIRIEKIKIKSKWVTAEINSKTLQLLKKLELTVT